MRFIEIFDQLQEGIPMGQKALTSPKSMDYTIGFEFEVAVQKDAPSYSEYAEDEYDEFTEWYYNTGQFDREDWVNDYLRFTKDISDFVKENDIEPQYGAVSFDEFQKITDVEMKALFGNDYDKVLDLIEKDDQIRSLKYFEGKSKEELLQDTLELVYLDQKYLKKREKTPEEITDVFNIAYDVDTTKLKNILRSTYTNIEQFVNELSDEEDYADAPRIYSNSEKTEYIDPDELNDLDDLLKYYDITKEDVFDLLEDDINEAESEDMSATYERWLLNRGGSGSSEPISYVRYQLDEIGYNWSVVPDGTQGVDAEIVTPVFSLDEGLKVLEEIFNFIKDDQYIYTTEACGLHVNIGTWKGDEINRIDLFKFLTILNAQGILKDYDRVYNQFAKDKYQNIVQDFVSPRGIIDVKAYDTFVASVNKDILQRAEKFQSVNLEKLKNLGYIELRAMGNEDYETKFDKTKFHILKFIRSLEIAQNPNAYRNEYLKKVSKLFLKDTMKPDPLETFIKNTLNLRSRFNYVIDELLVLEPNILSTHYNKDVYKALVSQTSDPYWGKTFADEIKREVDKLSDEEKEQLTKSLFGRHMLKIATTGKL